MNLVDKLLALDKSELSNKVTSQIEIKRLSEKIGEPFIITLESLEVARYQELQLMCINKKGGVDFEKSKDVNLLMVLESIKNPNLGDEKLQKHFGAATPKELVTKLFTSGEIEKIQAESMKVNGAYDDEEEEEEIKN